MKKTTSKKNRNGSIKKKAVKKVAKKPKTIKVTSKRRQTKKQVSGIKPHKQGDKKNPKQVHKKNLKHVHKYDPEHIHKKTPDHVHKNINTFKHKFQHKNDMATLEHYHKMLHSHVKNKDIEHHVADHHFKEYEEKHPDYFNTMKSPPQDNST